MHQAPSDSSARELLLARLPRWYSGWLHLALINAVTLAAIGLCLAALDQPTWWQWLTVPALFVFANAFEWWIHRGPMHHLTRWLPMVYRRHTGEHHRFFTAETMGLHGARDFYYVLFPPWFLPLLLLMNLPIPLLLGWLVSWNLALLFYATGLTYYLVYEWLHFSHHIPADSWYGRRPLIAWLRRHHQRHHQPRRMTQGNFNVSFPLWDHVRGTVLHADDD